MLILMTTFGPATAKEQPVKNVDEGRKLAEEFVKQHPDGVCSVSSLKRGKIHKTIIGYSSGRWVGSHVLAG